MKVQHKKGQALNVKFPVAPNNSASYTLNLCYLCVTSSLIRLMYKLFIALFSLLPFLATSQQLMVVDGLYCTTDSMPYTGQYTSYYPTGIRAAVYNLKDGKLHNSVAFYTESGSIDCTGSYYYGQKDGIWRSHDKRGRVMSRIKYRKGQKTGEWVVRNDFSTDAYLMYFANDRLLTSRTIDSRQAQMLTRR